MAKKFLLSCLAFVCIFCGISYHASAEQTSFSIKSNSNYLAKSSANIKLDYNKMAYVDWTSSNYKSHNEWVQVVNSNSEIRSESVLFAYCGDGTIDEYDSVTYGYYYYLRARREHIINPTTTVKGNWES